MALRTIPGLKDIQPLKLIRTSTLMAQVIQSGVRTAKESEEAEKRRVSALNLKILKGADPSRVVVRGRS